MFRWGGRRQLVRAPDGKGGVGGCVAVGGRRPTEQPGQRPRRKDAGMSPQGMEARGRAGQPFAGHSQGSL